MRLNNMNPYNEKRKDFFGYVVMAVACGFVFYFFVRMFTNIVLALWSIAYRYWWGTLIIVALVIIFKIRGRKK